MLVRGSVTSWGIMEFNDCQSEEDGWPKFVLIVAMLFLTRVLLPTVPTRAAPRRKFWRWCHESHESVRAVSWADDLQIVPCQAWRSGCFIVSVAYICRKGSAAC